MGAHNSNLKRCITEEYDRVRDPSREYLILRELLTFRVPNLIQLDLSHTGVLFVLDRGATGQFQLGDLLAFYDTCADRAKLYRPHEFQAYIQGYCSLQLWSSVATPEGKQNFTNWFGALVLNNEKEVHTFEEHTGVTFVTRDTLQIIYEILNVTETHGMDFQSFFDLLQRVGEEKGTMDLENEALDDYAPLDVIEDFAGKFIGGFREGINLDALELLD
mmetsp:Transcript_14550/g.17627  ORF Transcript_14550/g.17627 Transcript_14550/m.17627 type:complete len:218 (+) Transcript_14550:206-859(+)